jgi:hypothetical protein
MINTDDCLLWAGFVNKDYGYISIKRNGKWSTTPIHRALYEAERGVLPKELVVDHLCRVKRCINLEHLEAVTNQVNIQRGVFKKSTKTHCKHGHEFTEQNTILAKRGTRHCRECHKRWHREWYAKHK